MIDEQLKKTIIENEENFTDILGQDNVKYQLKSTLISNRHLIIIGQPGIGKTTLAKNLAKVLPEIEVNNCGFNCIPNQPHCPKCKTEKQEKKMVKGTDRFIRIQGSPDLTVEDFDINTLNGNMGYALVLYKVRGVKDWECSKKFRF